MNILSFLRPKSTLPTADQAKERLKIVLAHERSYASAPDYLPRLQNEILQVIARYVELEQDKLSVKLENFGSTSRLEVNIDLPKTVQPVAASPATSQATTASDDPAAAAADPATDTRAVS
ncbi:MAG: cell division topological specificity factor MinE [Defluviicoccus sp.]